MTNHAAPGARTSDQQWSDIKRHLPANLVTRVTKREAEYRQFVDTVLWVVQNNATWSDVHHPVGTSRSVYVRYLRWVELGRWECVARGLGGTLGDDLLAHVERARARLQWRAGRQKVLIAGKNGTRPA
ncbi:transposase [Stenotrophomonas tuberculopleuritidis]|uniref:transposase n=1 Tax=Stenotrophomonas tuberculopleuritidis TaxID=3055079 RepID=UPI003FA1EF12